ncbi:MAG: sulfotransferase [Brevirhabdus sp.]
MTAANSEHIVAIGGVGGSGTRLVAEILQTFGWDLGQDLNGAHDNLWFTILFQRPDWFSRHPDAADIRHAVNVYFAARTVGLATLADPSIAALVQALIDRLEQPSTHPTGADRGNAERLLASKPTSSARWGWKEPNTHVFLPELAEELPELRYIHVIRDGRDMAYSANQNQLRNWGAWMLGDKADIPNDATRSLEYWLCANERACELGDTVLKDRFFLLNYDRLCTDPASELEPLAAFLGVPLNERVMSLIKPRSIGRHEKHDPTVFGPDQLARVKHLMALMH